MPDPAPRGHVVGEADLPMRPLPDAAGWVRVPIDGAVGCRNLVQRVFRFERGATPILTNEASEDVMYVASGRGEIRIGGEAHVLEPGTGVLVPPGVDHEIENPGPHDLVIVSVLSPQPGGPALRPDRSDPRSTARSARGAGPRSVREADETPLPAGEDRSFKLLIDPRLGSRNVTQFVGFIDRSRAPFHTHTYEEAMYILEGRGIVHIDDRHVPIEAGSSVFLPPGTSHCLENEGPEILKVLGVFSPPGSPANKRDEPDA